MNASPSVVPGEAPESDDESEGDKRATSALPRSVVSGEAPESSSSASSEFQDDASKPTIKENEPKLSCAPSASTSPALDVREKVLRSIRAQRKESLPSLLYTKLRENNSSLRASLTDFVRQIGQQTNTGIIAIDNDLLRSQMTLQEAITAYRQINRNVMEINAALSLSPSLNGIPKIDIRTVL